MRSPLPEVAEALGVPMEVAPAWLRAEGRPTFGCRTLEELKKEAIVLASAASLALTEQAGVNSRTEDRTHKKGKSDETRHTKTPGAHCAGYLILHTLTLI